MRAWAIVWTGIAALSGCVEPPSAAPPPTVAGAAESARPGAAGSAGSGDPARPMRRAAASMAMPGDVPDRDPAARGRFAVDMTAADLPDDRDGDGVDQLELCPELLPDRVDGCPHTR